MWVCELKLYASLTLQTKVVIGGGTSGLVLSSRLAERGEKVLVIEAGIE